MFHGKHSISDISLKGDVPRETHQIQAKNIPLYLYIGEIDAKGGGVTEGKIGNYEIVSRCNKKRYDDFSKDSPKTATITLCQTKSYEIYRHMLSLYVRFMVNMPSEKNN